MKTWKEAVKDDMKKRNLCLKMLGIKTNGGVAEDWPAPIIQDDRRAIKRQMKRKACSVL